jgi:dienelactone hydrolase
VTLNGAPNGTRLVWSEQDSLSKGVLERRFDVQRDGRLVPGLLWTPEGARGPRPLVLVGHGAGNHKREQYILSLARRLVRHSSFAVAAIDGPVHGDRRSDASNDGTLMLVEFGNMWANDPNMTDEMVADWQATLDGLSELEEVGEGPVGWWGLSMGTILGIPFVAAEKRIQAAVLGLMGTAAPNQAFKERFVRDAREVRCPVLFLLQWDDELMLRRDVLALFDELGTTDKRLHANPGGHTGVPPEEFEASETFLARRLGPVEAT